jgi:hypothetical protein
MYVWGKGALSSLLWTASSRILISLKRVAAAVAEPSVKLRVRAETKARERNMIEDTIAMRCKEKNCDSGSASRNFFKINAQTKFVFFLWQERDTGTTRKVTQDLVL